MWVQYYDVIENETFIQYYFSLGVILFLFWGWAINLKKGNNNISIGKKQVHIGFSMLFVLFFLIFITFVISYLWFSKRSQYLELTDIIHTNSYKIVEGNVKNFVPEKKPQQEKEKFTIKNIPFEYTSDNSFIGYNKPKCYGGVIDANKYVRIHYYEGEILRLWVLEETKK